MDLLVGYLRVVVCRSRVRGHHLIVGVGFLTHRVLGKLYCFGRDVVAARARALTYLGAIFLFREGPCGLFQMLAGLVWPVRQVLVGRRFVNVCLVVHKFRIFNFSADRISVAQSDCHPR